MICRDEKLTFYVFIVSTSLFFIKAQAGTGIQPIPDLPSFINPSL